MKNYNHEIIFWLSASALVMANIFGVAFLMTHLDDYGLIPTVIGMIVGFLFLIITLWIVNQLWPTD